MNTIAQKPESFVLIKKMVKNSLQKAVMTTFQSRAAFGNVFVPLFSQIAATGCKKQLRFYKGKLPYNTKVGGFSPNFFGFMLISLSFIGL